MDDPNLMNLYLVVLFVGLCACGGVAAYVADARGHSATVGFFLGFFLGLFGLLAIGLLPVRPKQSSAELGPSPRSGRQPRPESKRLRRPNELIEQEEALLAEWRRNHPASGNN